jgi:predicted TIM-barrel fold metal-dependent hydrolase
MKELLHRHPKTTIIWAHVGLGRVVHPVQTSASTSATERSPVHIGIVKALLDDPTLKHLHFDISWDEVAKYVVATPQATKDTAAMINQYPDRFLFGTDEVAPTDQEKYLKVYRMYEPLWKLLSPQAREKVTKGNYESLFDAARKKVRAWESANVKGR